MVSLVVYQTKLNSFLLRQYDAVIARWTTTDPKGEFFSPYLANANNPISTIDPDGGSTQDIWNYNTKTKSISHIVKEGPDEYHIDGKLIFYDLGNTHMGFFNEKSGKWFFPSGVKTEIAIPFKEPYQFNSDMAASLGVAIGMTEEIFTLDNRLNMTAKGVYKGLGIGGFVVGLAYDGYNVYNNKGSTESVTRFCVGLGIGASAFIPYVGYYMSAGLTIMDQRGDFDDYYRNPRKYHRIAAYKPYGVNHMMKYGF